jgi:hypothetical protein
VAACRVTAAPQANADAGAATTMSTVATAVTVLAKPRPSGSLRAFSIRAFWADLHCSCRANAIVLSGCPMSTTQGRSPGPRETLTLIPSAVGANTQRFCSRSEHPKLRVLAMSSPASRWVSPSVASAVQECDGSGSNQAINPEQMPTPGLQPATEPLQREQTSQKCANSAKETGQHG